MTRFDSTEYEFSHGKKPRGRGYWAIGRSTKANVFDTTQCVFIDGTITEVKKKAVEHFKNPSVLYILP